MSERSDAQQPAPLHPVDEDALARWLADHVEGFAGPVRMERFRGGQSNPTYRLRTPARDYVLRAKPAPAAQLLPSAHAIEREYRVMRALADTDVPVARMFALCEDESVIGRAFYVMEFVEGRVFWRHDLPELTPPQRAAIYDEMNRVMAAVHRLDPTQIGLAGFGRPGHYVERQIARWTAQYEASKTEHDPAMDRLIAWLPSHVPALDRLIAWLPSHVPALARDERFASIVHGDGRIDNLMFHPTQPRIVAVLDWELSTIGHPLADFAYQCMAWRITPAMFRGLAGLDLAALGVPSERAYLERYCVRMGLPIDDVTSDWPFFLAFNLFRLAAIMQGIGWRITTGAAAGADAPELAALARPFARLACDIIAQA